MGGKYRGERRGEAIEEVPRAVLFYASKNSQMYLFTTGKLRARSTMDRLDHLILGIGTN